MAGKEKAVEIKIPENILELLDAMPAARPGSIGRQWQPWEDEVLIKYWKVKSKPQLARMFGVAEGTARERYRKLTEGKK